MSNDATAYTTVPPRARQKTSMVPIALATLSGSALEWYDFFLYGTAAALVFNKIMFPTTDPYIGTLLAFGTYALGFLARPLGGIVFGRLGDRIGRKAVLILTLVIMGAATVGMGLLPTYAMTGLAAPVLLIALRLVQGLGAGAEFGGAAILAVEFSSRGRRGLHGSWPAVGVFVGLLLSSGIFAIMTTALSPEAFLAWGWRIPFLLSILVVATALIIRVKVSETPAFEKLKSEDQVSKQPVREILRTQKKPLFILMGAQVAQNGNSYVYLTFATSYIVGTLGLASSLGPLGVALGAAVTLVTIPFFGWLSDRIGRKPVILFGALSGAAFAFPFFWLLQTKSEGLVLLALVIGIGVGNAAMFGPQGAFFSELFTSRVRFSGLSMGREIASAAVGGFVPLVAVALVGWSGHFWPVAVLTILICLTGVLAMSFSAETKDRSVEAAELR
ncbi:MFS transporter [Sinomonas notoginsengisoli]|uniref:MFS transporter n=1 Tax=Sinomonas notoginsengisoli TaxID=1457311 RepID=UPI001F2B3ACA|nr:MFS transporter [Sinomonas notoginsengisoli]